MNTISIQWDGKIFVGGSFYMYDSIFSTRMICLNVDGSQNTDFDLWGNIWWYNDIVRAIVFQSGGKILVGGDFRTYNRLATNRIIRLTSTWDRDTSFNIWNWFDSIVRTVAFQSDGKIIAGGDFTVYNWDAVGSIIRLNADGTKDTAFSIWSWFDGNVHKIVMQSDGKILVGGEFENYNWAGGNKIIRLNSDGTRDNTFSAIWINDIVYSILVQNDGKILVGGWSSKNLVRLTTTWAQDTTFKVWWWFNNPVMSLAIQSDGKILVGGDFQTFSWASANYIIRLNTGGTKDSSFNIGTAFDGYVTSIWIQSGGKIVVGWWFTKYKWLEANFMVRLTTLGARDTSFNAGWYWFDADVESLVVQNDNKIVAAGIFSSYNWIPALYIARLNADGTKDNGFYTIWSSFNDSISNIAIQTGGKIFAWGFFTNYNWVAVWYLASLYGDSDVVILPNSTDTTTLTDRFISKWYVQTGWDFVWSKAISLNETDGNVPLSFNVKNQNIKVTIPADTQFKESDNVTNYNGIISVPVTKSINSINDEQVLSAFKIGSNSESIKLAWWVATLSIPAVGETIWDRVQIYYSEDNGINRYLQTNANVINVGWQPTIEFTTNHFTDFAITIPWWGPFTWSFTINNDASATTGNIVTLDISTTPSAVNMRFSNDWSTRSSREPYDGAKDRTLDWGYGSKTVYAQFDTYGDQSYIINANATIMYALATWAILINGGSTSTDSVDVTLDLSTTPVVDPQRIRMSFSNDNINRSNREQYSPAKARTLDWGYGNKVVYGQFTLDWLTPIFTSGSINYAAPWGWAWGSHGSSTWNLRLEITTTSWSCSYGTSLYIGSHASQFAAYDMTGSNFSSSFSCIDTEGLSGWTMTMEATTDLSDGAQTISKDNVSLIASPNYVSAGACTTGTNQDSWVSIGSTPGTILWKSSGQWDICTITSDTVNLAVHIPASQAVGLYTGTLSLNMPF